jgi:hypothetical protein
MRKAAVQRPGFSHRERAAYDLFKKPTISREAVGWNPLLARYRWY